MWIHSEASCRAKKKKLQQNTFDIKLSRPCTVYNTRATHTRTRCTCWHEARSIFEVSKAEYLTSENTFTQGLHFGIGRPVPGCRLASVLAVKKVSPSHSEHGFLYFLPRRRLQRCSQNSAASEAAPGGWAHSNHPSFMSRSVRGDVWFAYIHFNNLHSYHYSCHMNGSRTRV